MRRAGVLTAGALWVLATGCGSSDGGGAPSAHLSVDADRDGALDPPGADLVTWDATRGAILLANVDDDASRGDSDAADDVVDGDADIDDLAPLAVSAWPDAPDGASATLAVDGVAAPPVRLFRVTGDPASAAGYAVDDASGATLDAAALRAGARFALEAVDFASSTAEGGFGGAVEATLEVRDDAGAVVAREVARLRVAPVVFQHDLARAEAVYYTDFGFDSAPLLRGLKPAAQAADALTPVGLAVDDQWAQDYFDVGLTSRPGPGGVPVVMKVALRSAQPWRDAGAVTTDQLRGPGWGTVFTHAEPYDDQTLGDSLNSFGNWTVVPPHEHAGTSWPLGRHLWGRSATIAPDAVFEEFVRAQRVQGELHIDTTWLYVGHVDELVSFVPATTPHGFRLLVASPKRARQMLLDLQAGGHGDAKLFTAKKWVDDNGAETSAETTVDAVLADADRLAASEDAQTRIDEATATLRAELGLADDEITEMPFLFERVAGAGLAYQPGTVNLLHLDGHVVMPDPFGPVVDGVDTFRADLEARLGAAGLTVHFADDWDLYHRLDGEVHCATNVARAMPGDWWKGAR